MTKKENFQCSLSINRFELPVFLGWPQTERQERQIVSIDIHISFKTPPKACDSDNLEDTFCYSQLTDQIKQATANKQFHLLEHLTKVILTITKKIINDIMMVSVEVTKKPSIDGLMGGVTFHCIEFEESNVA